MTKQHNFTRRALLAGSAAIVSSAALAGAVVPALAATPAVGATAPAYLAETPQIVSALVQLAAARKALTQASTDLEWFVAEWGYRWPLAPEEILGFANAQTFYGKDTFVETDILGAPLFRDTADLTRRLSANMRQKSPKLCFALETPAELSERIDTARGFKIRGRSERTRAKHQAQMARDIASLEKALALSEQYFAERAAILELSGAANMIKRRDAARQAVIDGFDAVAAAQVTTTWGLRAKALACLANGDAKTIAAFKPFGGGIYEGHLLAVATVKMTQPENGDEWPLIKSALSDALAIADAKASA